MVQDDTVQVVHAYAYPAISNNTDYALFTDMLYRANIQHDVIPFSGGAHVRVAGVTFTFSSVRGILHTVR